MDNSVGCGKHKLILCKGSHKKYIMYIIYYFYQIYNCKCFWSYIPVFFVSYRRIKVQILDEKKIIHTYIVTVFKIIFKISHACQWLNFYTSVHNKENLYINLKNMCLASYKQDLVCMIKKIRILSTLSLAETVCEVLGKHCSSSPFQNGRKEKNHFICCFNIISLYR